MYGHNSLHPAHHSHMFGFLEKDTLMDLQAYIRHAPKAELHVHLEGSVQPATLMALAKRNHIEPPAETLDELRQFFIFRDFAHFIQTYAIISRYLRTVEDYELITYEFGEQMAQQNVRYAEATFSVCTHRFMRGIPHDVYFTGLTRGRERARRDFGVEINWVFDIVRDVASGPGMSERADYTTSVAIESRNDGVVALGLGGMETGFPPEWFESWFDKARAAGLHSAPHAGEVEGPKSVWGAIRALGAERIGHGVRSIEDPLLIAELINRDILLEVCPTSNIKLGVYPTLEQHPLPQLVAAGVPCTVNSDDPPLFNTTMLHEAELLDSAFHFDKATIDNLLLNGVKYSFLPSARKEKMLREFQEMSSTLMMS